MQFVFYIVKKSIHHIYSQAIAWTNTNSLFIGILRTNFGEFGIKYKISFTKYIWKNETVFSKMVAMFFITQSITLTNIYQSFQHFKGRMRYASFYSSVKYFVTVLLQIFLCSFHECSSMVGVWVSHHRII